MKRFLPAVLLLLLLTAPVSAEVVLTLPPGEGNPRNSEGDFIQLEDGRLLFIYTRFTGGGSDHDKADLMSRESTDGGATWSTDDKLVVKNEGDMNVMSVSLLRLADGRIALFYLQKNSLADCRPIVRFSTDEAKTWSEPTETIPDSDNGYYVLNNDRVVQLKSGRLVLPLCLHNRPGWEKMDWQGQILCYFSDDSGKTWQASESLLKGTNRDGKRIVTQEPGVVELQDGRLLLWCRTNAGVQYQSYSSDGGNTWSGLKPMGLASPVSPASIEYIPGTDTLLAVWNNHDTLPPEERKLRTPLTMAVSSDEGRTWKIVENVRSAKDGWYCYTAITFADDYVLLGYVAGEQKPGQHLATTEISRFPVSQLVPLSGSF
ncbi:sialidase family protein [Rubinisphaera margarita]|uniref:sialidase family protein n=1 Tax=Rubinisphaera margarita TaxID=2909586 RepID=UPI001EE9A986|nr:sialidase family protein [Rubinisphaera margarita]MCG6154780.1 glycoside hydrolase [Rubinisphaera margarita]